MSKLLRERQLTALMSTGPENFVDRVEGFKRNIKDLMKTTKKQTKELKDLAAAAAAAGVAVAANAAGKRRSVGDATPGDAPAWHTVLSGMPAFEKQAVLEHPEFVQLGDAAKLQLLLRYNKFLGHRDGRNQELREGILSNPGFRKQIERVREHGMTLEPPDDAERITQLLARLMQFIDVDAESSATHHPTQLGSGDPSVNATPDDALVWHTVLSGMPALEKQAVARALGIKDVDHTSESELHRKVLEHPEFVQLGDAAKLQLLLRYKSHNITDETIKNLPTHFLRSLSSKFLGHCNGTIEELREGILPSPGFRKQIERVREHGMTLEPPDDGKRITQLLARLMQFIDVDAESSATHHPTQLGSGHPSVNATPGDMPAWHTVLSDMPTFEKRAIAKALGIKSVDHTSDSKLHRKVLEHPEFVQLGDAAKLQLLLRYKSHNITDETIKNLPTHFLRSLSSKFLGHRDGRNQELREGILSNPGFRKQIERVREHGMTLEPPDDAERIARFLARLTQPVGVDAGSLAAQQPAQAASGDLSADGMPSNDKPTWRMVLSRTVAFEKQAVAKALGAKNASKMSAGKAEHMIVTNQVFSKVSNESKLKFLLAYRPHNITEDTINDLPKDYLKYLARKFDVHTRASLDSLQRAILSSAGFHKQIERVHKHGMTLEPPDGFAECITQSLARIEQLIGVDAGSSATHRSVQAGSGDFLAYATPGDLPAWRTVLSDMPTFEKRAVAKTLGIKNAHIFSDLVLSYKILVYPAFVQLSDAAKLQLLLRFKSHNITDQIIEGLPWNFLIHLSDRFLGRRDGTNKELRKHLLSSPGFRKQIERVHEHGMTLEPPVDDALARLMQFIDVDAGSSATHHPTQLGSGDPSVDVTPGDAPAWHTVLSGMPAFEKQAVARALGIKDVDHIPESELHRKILEHPVFVQLGDAAKLQLLLRYKSHNITDETIKNLPTHFLRSLSSKFLGHRDGRNQELREGILSNPGFRKQIERVREHGMTLEPPDDAERIARSRDGVVLATPDINAESKNAIDTREPSSSTSELPSHPLPSTAVAGGSTEMLTLHNKPL
ncbi:hypothetical protein HK105_200796 [Polyrhizophydium stewartii]|uniref:Uncharacterized protein n=1 Tax=Polyrhizophydium stewartii TaxID=2732419 RepID=A0ABR4NKC4_9FUNG